MDQRGLRLRIFTEAEQALLEGKYQCAYLRQSNHPNKDEYLHPGPDGLVCLQCGWTQTDVKAADLLPDPF